MAAPDGVVEPARLLGGGQGCASNGEDAREGRGDLGDEAGQSPPRVTVWSTSSLATKSRPTPVRSGAATSRSAAIWPRFLAIGPCASNQESAGGAIGKSSVIGQVSEERRRPKSPQYAAGMRIEPPMSVPQSNPTIPSATAAAAPPELPPAVRLRSCGLRVVPPTQLSDSGTRPYTEVGLANEDRARVVEHAHDPRVDRERRRGGSRSRGRRQAERLPLVLEGEGDAVHQDRGACWAGFVLGAGSVRRVLTKARMWGSRVVIRWSASGTVKGREATPAYIAVLGVVLASRALVGLLGVAAACQGEGTRRPKCGGGSRRDLPRRLRTHRSAD